MKNIARLILFLFIVLTSCKSASMKTADDQFKQGEYYESARTYRKVIGKISGKNKDERAEAYFKMGRAYQLYNQTSRAESAYNYAIKAKYSNPLVYLYMAQVKQKLGRYKEAATNYQLYLDADPTNQQALNALRMCEQIDDLRKNPSRYLVRMAPTVNYTGGSDYSSAFLGKEGEQLFFATTRRQAKGKDKSKITGQKNADIYFSVRDEKGRWAKPKPVEGEINTPADEGAVSISGDGMRMYFTRSRNQDEAVMEIMYSQRNEEEWGNPQVLKVTKDSLTAVGQPSISPQGDWLYFVSDMPGGVGGLDIWRGKMIGNDISFIENMGEEINTPEDEMFPFIRETGVLYFASKGHPGFGGLDLFKATPNQSGKWEVVNMGMPLNSAGDDFGIAFYNLEEKGFLSSDRGASRGYDRLYSFELPELKCFLEGTVKNDRKQPLREAKVHVVGDNGFYQKQPVRTDGSFRFKLEQGVKYAVQASCRGYLSVADYFDTPVEEKDFIHKKDFVLMPIAKTIRVDNVLFDFNKATLRPESKDALNYLVMILNENPNITIELASHTDIIGSAEYNLDLSNRRAQSVVDYLIHAGIEKERLTPKGYGKTVPVVVDDDIADKYPFLNYGDVLSESFINALPEEQQEIARQLSRRTEFRVLRTDYNLY